MRFICKAILWLVLVGLYLGVFAASPAHAAGETPFAAEEKSLNAVTAKRMRDTGLRMSGVVNVQFSKNWIDDLPKPKGGPELRCLAEALHREGGR